MIFQQTFYNFIVYVYALSLLFYSADIFGQRNRRSRQLGTGLITFVWSLETLFFIYRMTQSSYIPIYTMFETLIFFSWLLTTLGMILQLALRMDLFSFFVNAGSFVFLIGSLFFDPSSTATIYQWHKEEQFVFIHILFALTAYAVFCLSAVFSGTYLFLHKKLKGKQWSFSLFRLPSLDQMDRYAFRCVISGVLLLMISLVFAFFWIMIIGDLALLFDIKVMSTLGLLIVYVVYVLLHYQRDTSAKRRAWLNLICCAILFLNLFFFNYTSTFHQWTWV